jgi:hypothetical protein
VPAEYVVVVSVVVVPVTGFVFVVSVVVLVCANAKGAISAQANVRMLFFILPPLMLIFNAPACAKTRPLAKSGLYSFDWVRRARIRVILNICMIDSESVRELSA